MSAATYSALTGELSLEAIVKGSTLLTCLVSSPSTSSRKFAGSHSFFGFGPIPATGPEAGRRLVSAGGQEFVRAYSQSVYEIPVDQVIGSSILTRYSAKGGVPVLQREAKPFFINDHDGKPVGINLFIGKRPIAAFGNSSGDAEMLQWTGAGKGPRLMMLVLHDDEKREYAYGPAAGLPDTKVGAFPQSLMDEAKKSGWSVISMKNDWKRVFAFDD